MSMYCPSCTKRVPQRDYDALATRLAEAEARYQRVMAVIRPLCAKYAPDLLAEFDAATASTVANSGDGGKHG